MKAKRNWLVPAIILAVILVFPEFIGYWMKVFNLAGPGDPTHISRE